MKLRVGNGCWHAGHVRAAAICLEAGFFAQEGLDVEVVHARINPKGFESSRPDGERYDEIGTVLRDMIIEPVPVRLIELQGVTSSAANPYAALLWLEFQATPTGQRIIDKYEPLKSSVFGPGSELAKVTEGKRLSIDKWDSFEQIPGWYEMIEKAFGLPQAEKLKSR